MPLFGPTRGVKFCEVLLTALTVTVPSIVHGNSLSPLSAPLSTLLHFYSIQQLTHLDQIYLIERRCWKEEDIFSSILWEPRCYQVFIVRNCGDCWDCGQEWDCSDDGDPEDIVDTPATISVEETGPCPAPAPALCRASHQHPTLSPHCSFLRPAGGRNQLLITATSRQKKLP